MALSKKQLEHLKDYGKVKSVKELAAELETSKQEIRLALKQLEVTGGLRDKPAPEPFIPDSEKISLDRNDYLKSAKAFCNWMVRDGRANSNPLHYLRRVNAQVDCRRTRRALSPGEVQRLIVAAQNGPVYQGISGRERAVLYRLALETGLRAGEIRSLTRSSFDLGGTPPTVTVEAACSKRRRTDVLPLRPETAAVLKSHTADMLPMAKVFPVIPAKTSMMMKFDLEAAGIPYKNESGHYADFHSLRHTFITNLARSGVHPKVTQELARHSTINLTLERYTHTSLETQVEAVGRLPNIGDIIVNRNKIQVSS